MCFSSAASLALSSNQFAYACAPGTARLDEDCDASCKQYGLSSASSSSTRPSSSTSLAFAARLFVVRN
ncbi:hypothetical protein PR003_g2748 [Phytophthora rubi]|uniref:Uncharacterized protein n=1 Tax=Phytophthora rubi TaxID=129364 RepID=A0A6A4FRX4_9STRA|nr:hypothetical protein PR001_g2213 [Phytophthora rubi]KAE9355633.1 hypothetical protein PR003_g2748 [Phytophthora rubi]